MVKSSTGLLIGLAALGIGAYLLLKPKSTGDLTSSGGTGFIDTGTPTTSGLPMDLQPIFNKNNPASPNISLKAVSFESTSKYAAGTTLGQSLPKSGTPNTYSPSAGIGYNAQGQGYSAMKPIVNKNVTSTSNPVNNLNSYFKPQYQIKGLIS